MYVHKPNHIAPSRKPTSDLENVRKSYQCAQAGDCRAPLELCNRLHRTVHSLRKLFVRQLFGEAGSAESRVRVAMKSLMRPGWTRGDRSAMM